MVKKDCSFAETIIHLVLLFGIGIYIGMSMNDESLAKENRIKELTSNLTNEVKAYQTKIDNATIRVNNNTNFLGAMEGRFDSECIELSDVFLQNAKNDKLKFYFKKKFLKKPNVLMQFKQVRLSTAKGIAPGELKLSYSVAPENINIDHFKYSINVVGNGELISAVEMCYIAFEEMRKS